MVLYPTGCRSSSVLPGAGAKRTADLYPAGRNAQRRLPQAPPAVVGRRRGRASGLPTGPGPRSRPSPVRRPPPGNWRRASMAGVCRQKTTGKPSISIRRGLSLCERRSSPLFSACLMAASMEAASMVRTRRSWTPPCVSPRAGRIRRLSRPSSTCWVGWGEGARPPMRLRHDATLGALASLSPAANRPLQQLSLAHW